MSDYLGRGRGTAALVRDVVEHVLDETLDHDLAVDDSRLVSLGPRPTCTYAPAGRLPRERTRRCWFSAREVPRRTLVTGHERRGRQSREAPRAGSRERERAISVA